MKLKSFLLVLGLIFVNTCVYAQRRDMYAALEAVLDKEGARIVRQSAKVPRLTNTPLSKFAVTPYRIPRQRFTVLGNISHGTFIMDPRTDTRKVVPRPSYQDRWKWKNACFDKLYREFVDSRTVLFRGMGVNNLAEIENLLRNGSEIEKTSYDAIYFSAILSDTIFFMEEEIRGGAKIPVLITVKLSSYEDWEFIDLDSPLQHILPFYENIPAAEQEVFAYLRHNGEYDWYHVSLTEQGKIITQLLSAYLKEKNAAK